MGLQNCQIYLDNPNATYFPGQNVTGRVDLNFSTPKKVRGISVSFKGQANTHWTESESYRNSAGKTSHRSVSYHASEEYFHNKYYFIGGPNNDSIELAPGNHTYPLASVLPTILPSSFEGDKGYVRYTVKVTLDRPWKFDQTLKVAFTVIAHLDVNLNPRAREPATLTMEKYFCCCFCASGPLTGILKLPYTGYVPGQSIPCTVEIDNISNINVQNIKLKLKKIVSYHSHTPRRKTKKYDFTIAEAQIGLPVNGKSSKTFNHSLAIPSLPPSNLLHCGIIDIDYEIRVTVEVEGMHRNMYGTIPITIGTIPLTNMVPMQSTSMHPVESGVNQVSLGWIPAPPNSPPIDPYLLPPPSYEECQFGAKTILDENDSEYTKFNNDKQYAPSYPVYNFNIMPQMPNLPPGNVNLAGPSLPTAPSQ